MSKVLQLSEEEFEARLNAGGTMLVDFYADWCVPCKRMAPVVEQLADAFAGKIDVAKVDTQEAPHLVQRYGIQSIPALLVFRDGKGVADFIGARPYEELAAALESLT